MRRLFCFGRKPGMEKQVLNRRKDVELFEAIRREYQFGEGTVKGVARKFGVHRRMVREALADAVPKQRKIIERVRPKLEPAGPFIDAILESDLKAPRKQRWSPNWAGRDRKCRFSVCAVWLAQARFTARIRMLASRHF